MGTPIYKILQYINENDGVVPSGQLVAFAKEIKLDFSEFSRIMDDLKANGLIKDAGIDFKEQNGDILFSGRMPEFIYLTADGKALVAATKNKTSTKVKTNLSQPLLQNIFYPVLATILGGILLFFIMKMLGLNPT
ncbi:MAG: hypothetical protein RIG68_14115 [Imperialibacter sp.]|uniref:hypothetical protein n=1 Tax=Imperialibacter sp. TaxID=2038411 RepID=UPI0032EEDD26